MGMEVRFLVEPLVASNERALKRLLTCMDPQVGLQIKVQGELFPAFLAFVRLLTL